MLNDGKPVLQTVWYGVPVVKLCEKQKMILSFTPFRYPSDRTDECETTFASAVPTHRARACSASYASIAHGSAFVRMSARQRCLRAAPSSLACQHIHMMQAVRGAPDRRQGPAPPGAPYPPCVPYGGARRRTAPPVRGATDGVMPKAPRPEAGARRMQTAIHHAIVDYTISDHVAYGGVGVRCGRRGGRCSCCRPTMRWPMGPRALSSLQSTDTVTVECHVRGAGARAV